MDAIKAMRVFAFLALLSVSASSVALAEEVVTVKPEYGGRLNFILLKPDRPKAAVVLFPGGRGYLKLSDDGAIRRQKKSFLVHNREDFADRGFMVAVFNPPSGMDDLDRTYRMSEAHGQDMRFPSCQRCSMTPRTRRLKTAGFQAESQAWLSVSRLRLRLRSAAGLPMPVFMV